MRAVIQRVSSASVIVEKQSIANIKAGLLVLLGIEKDDTEDDAYWLSKKISRIRIFSDENGLMNRSVQEVNGEIMIVSQFTLFASTKKGNRPSFTKAAKPQIANPLYKLFCDQISNYYGIPVKTGRFGATMDVSLNNMGPVTIIMDSKARE